MAENLLLALLAFWFARILVVEGGRAPAGLRPVQPKEEGRRMSDDSTVTDAALSYLLKARGSGGLGARQCEELAALLGKAGQESRLLAKASKACGAALATAKAALLACRAPDGDRVAYDNRQRAIGMLEDLAQGLAATDAERLRMLADAVALVCRTPQGHVDRVGTLPFRGKKT